MFDLVLLIVAFVVLVPYAFYLVFVCMPRTERLYQEYLELKKESERQSGDV